MTRNHPLWLVGGLAFAAFTVLIIALRAEQGEEGEGITARERVPYRQAAAFVDAARLAGHVDALSHVDSRVVGRAGYRQALEYVRRQFAALAFDLVVSETVEVVVPADGESTLSWDDGLSVPLHPLWPNGARACATPPEGLRGPLVYGGLGRARDLNGLAIEGAIVVLDWRAGQEWLLAPILGAKAVLFLPDEEATRVHARGKYLTLPADLPRFYVPSDYAPLVRQRCDDGAPTATVRSTARWSAETATSLLGVIRAPKSTATVVVDATGDICAYNRVKDATEPWQPVVLAAYFDAVSAVPALAPGAEQACGMAALLELARYFCAHPLEERDIVIFAAGAHGPSMAATKQFVRKHCLTPGPNGEPPWSPWLFAAIDLSSGTRRLAACHIGSFSEQFFFIVQPWISSFGLRISRYAEQLGEAFDADPQTLLVDAINPQRGRNIWVYFPYNPAFQSEPATLAGLPALTFATADDARLRVDTPADTPDRVDLDAVAVQVRTLAALLPNLLRYDGKVLTKQLPNQFVKLQGRVVTLDPKTSYIPDKPLPGALVEVKAFNSPKLQVGLRAEPRAIADASGHFEFDGLTHIAANSRLGVPAVEAYVIDATTGNVVYANDRSSARVNDYPSTIALDEPVKNLAVVLFPCESVTLYGMTDPLSYLRLFEAHVFDAGTNSPPYQYGFSYPNAQLGDREEAALVVFSQRDTPLRLALGIGPLQNRLVLLNASADNPLGTGFDVANLSHIRSIFFQGAWDLWHLNEDRLKTFREVGVSPQRLLRLHTEAAGYLERARAALEQRDYEEFIRQSYRGWSLEARAYPEVLSTANDMIHGVIFYLFLLLPFSYCCERLLLAGVTIGRRLTGILAVFLAGFAVLVLVHPAFRLTLTPLLVLLAFVILALSITVIAILIGKFDRMMWELRAATSGLHESDVSRVSAAARAIDLGIGNLRRRRQRTFLTCLTLVLVTFTLLSFTSIVPELATRSVPYDRGEATYEGMLFRDRSWHPMPLEQYHGLRMEYADEHTMVGRIWLFSEMVGQQSAVELFAAGKDGERVRRITVQALVGLEPDEAKVTPVERALTAGRWFAPGETRAVILTEHLARLLGLGPGDLGRIVNVYGEAMPLIGLINDEKFLAVKDIDGEPLTPVNYLLMAERLRKEGPADETELQEYIHLLPGDVALVPFDFLKIIEPSVRSVAVRFERGEDVAPALAELTRRTESTVFACADGKVSVYSAVNRLNLSATGGLMVPVAIGGLIVLASMLGAVFERRREIGVFNAVGLAPLHVSSLFLAEATVFALLGAIAGYLVGQVSARILIGFDLLPGVTLNYSAVATIYVTAFTMLVAILSTIYPAIQAYRIAIPEERRDSAQGRTEGDHIEVDLPFTATGDDAYGINAYLHEFLDAHVEASVGDISTERLQIRGGVAHGQPELHIQFRAWLKPFDLGVSQDVVVTTTYDAESGGHRLVMTIDRHSGDQNAWHRTRRHFLTVLRKQFLIWRILAPEEKERYIQRGKELFG